MTKQNILTQAMILLAEDDDDHYFIAQKAFQQSQLPFKLERVVNGKELIQHLEKMKQKNQSPSVIVLDLNMPRMDGREVLQIIAQHEEWSKIPIVALTTSPNEEDESLCLQRGVKRYLQKPVSFQEIVDIMNSLREFV